MSHGLDTFATTLDTEYRDGVSYRRTLALAVNELGVAGAGLTLMRSRSVSKGEP